MDSRIRYPNAQNQPRTSINVAATNTTPDVHALYAKISGAGRTRYLYAPELLTVFSSFRPPTLASVRATDSRVRVDVNGFSGQRIVLQGTIDFKTWQPLATNWLTTTQWTYFTSQEGNGRRFFRGKLSDKQASILLLA